MQNKKILVACFLFNFLLVLAVNYPVLVEIMDEWWSVGPYNHGLLGLALALSIFWNKRKVFAFPRGKLFTLPLLVAACILLLIANLASIGQLQVLSLFLVLLTLLISFYGFQPIRKLLLPLFMILLILPIWNLVQVPLREVSTWISFHSVNLLGFKIIRQGYKLITPGGSFVVEEACSGLGFFLASALYAVFVAQINHLSRKATCSFLAFSVVVAMIANWIRITVIVIVGSQTMMQHAIVQDHLTFGWFVFAACFVPVILVGNIYFGEQSPNKSVQKTTTQTREVSMKYLFSTSAIILVFLMATLLIPSRFDPDYKYTLPTIPSYKKLTLNSESSQNWHPVSYGATSEEFSYFLQDKDLLQVYLANYARQQQGAEMIFVKNSLFNKNRWFNAKQQTISLNSPALKQINLITINRDPLRSRLITYWYLIDGHFVNDKKTAKWYEVQAAFKGQPGATLIAIAFDFENGDKQYAIDAITHFTEAFTRQPINIKKSI